MKIILVSPFHQQVMVDDEDYQWLNDLHPWSITNKGAVQLRKFKNRVELTWLMSHLIMQPEEGYYVRFKNGNKRDMRRENLVVVPRGVAIKEWITNGKRVRNSKNYYYRPTSNTGGYWHIAFQRNNQRRWGIAKTEDEAKKILEKFKKELGAT